MKYEAEDNSSLLQHRHHQLLMLILLGSFFCVFFVYFKIFLMKQMQIFYSEFNFLYFAFILHFPCFLRFPWMNENDWLTYGCCCFLSKTLFTCLIYIQSDRKVEDYGSRQISYQIRLSIKCSVIIFSIKDYYLYLYALQYSFVFSSLHIIGFDTWIGLYFVFDSWQSLYFSFQILDFWLTRDFGSVVLIFLKFKTLYL